MAAARYGPVNSSALYGHSLYINYDDVTLVATSFSLSCGTVQPLTWWYQTSGGTIHSGTVPRGTAVASFTFPNVIQGVIENITITEKGNPLTFNNVLHFPSIVQMGCGNAPSVTPPNAM